MKREEILDTDRLRDMISIPAEILLKDIKRALERRAQRKEGEDHG